jgi:hypothetical protein
MKFRRLKPVMENALEVLAAHQWGIYRTREGGERTGCACRPQTMGSAAWIKHIAGYLPPQQRQTIERHRWGFIHGSESRVRPGCQGCGKILYNARQWMEHLRELLLGAEVPAA